MRRYCTCLIILLFMFPSVSFAQLTNPITDLEYGVTPDCPFDCDEVTIWISGVLPDFCWSRPTLTQWDRDENQFTLYMSTIFDPTIDCIQALQPFRVELPVGALPEGMYDVRYVIAAEHSMATMPVIPILRDDMFRVSPPGDMNCDGNSDMQDVIRLVDYTFRGAPMVDFERRADVSCNGRVNVIDVVSLIGHVLRDQPLCNPCDAVGALPRVRITDIDPDVFMRDSFELDTVRVIGDTLEVSLYRSGGCKDHTYAVYMSPSAFLESIPVQANLYVQHDDPDDPCDAWIHETLRFKLDSVRELYEQGYGPAGDIRLNVFDYGQQSAMSVLYSLE